MSKKNKIVEYHDTSCFKEGVEIPYLLDIEKTLFFEILRTMNSPRDLKVVIPRSQALEILAIDENDPNVKEIILKSLSRLQTIKASYFEDEAIFRYFVLFPTVTIDDEKLSIEIGDSFYPFLKKFGFATDSLSFTKADYSLKNKSGIFDTMSVAILSDRRRRKASKKPSSSHSD